MRILLPPSRAVDHAVPGDSAPLLRHTGVLFRALGIAEWTTASWRWARQTLVVHTLEHGLVAAGAHPGDEPVEVSELLAGPGPVVDLRSKEYQRRIAMPAGVWSVRVVSEGADGRRLAVSHWNKHHKGVLVGAMARDRPRPRSIRGVLSWASRSGFRLEPTGAESLDLLV